MKKILYTCFLGLLCLVGSTLTAQVADSPGADFLHRSSSTVPHELRDTHRGGETRPDTLPEHVDLVDNSDTQVGEHTVLIYLELAKRGAVDTLTFETIPFEVSQLYPNFRQKEAFVTGRTGNFFEGINPGNDKLYLFSTQEFTQPGYLSIKHGEEKLIDKYLVFPGDSVKIRIDDTGNRILFSGPDADLYACQYELITAIEQERFSRPSKMITTDPEALLDRDDYRMLYNKAQNTFGGSMQLISYGPEQLDHYMDQWNIPMEQLPGFEVLETYRSHLSPLAYQVLKADLVGKHKATLLQKFRIELYEPAVLGQDTVILDEVRQAVSILLSDEGIAELSAEAMDISSYWLDFSYEKAYLKALDSETSFSALVIDKYVGDLRAKILLELLVNKFRQIPTKAAFIDRIAPYMVTADQKGQLEEYRSKLAGAPVWDFQFQDRNGKMYSKDDFQDQVVVFYFWSTGCGASENFYNLSFDRIADKFLGSEAVELVAVNASPDQEIWASGLSSGKYTSDKLLNLYMGQDSEKWKMHYNINMYPQLMMMDAEGKISEIFYLGESTESIISQIESAASVGR
ncbi:hypothetical protein [Algoriphagus sp.]|uniref:TlpA family protein disulfide reductase n=1 Tax=Algoriphagus sp. TaxID=1872435 RepID=UPI00326D88E1